MPNSPKPEKAFYVSNRAWYAQKDSRPEIMIGLYFPEGGTSGEFAIRWLDIGRESVPRFEIFDDAWKVFLSFPEMKTIMELKRPTQDEMIAFLLMGGFKDLTVYSRPAGAGPEQRENTVRIEIRGGCLAEVSNLPPGWDYELIDHDNREENPEETTEQTRAP